MTALTLGRRDGATARLEVTPAQPVVIAAGGMGNAQLLMLPRGDGAVSVGNESGAVGRYLMEHPQFTLAGEVVTDAELDTCGRPTTTAPACTSSSRSRPLPWSAA